jgi:peptidoglycan/LPS O-acetylase OafA/YrhL
MKKIDSLTSLRFFAAACIVLGHGASRFHYRFDLFDLRHGVTFFFVLSGFILSYTYANFDWKNNYRDFFAARIARLYPACRADLKCRRCGTAAGKLPPAAGLDTDGFLALLV